SDTTSHDVAGLMPARERKRVSTRAWPRTSCSPGAQRVRQRSLPVLSEGSGLPVVRAWGTVDITPEMLVAESEQGSRPDPILGPRAPGLRWRIAPLAAVQGRRRAWRLQRRCGHA